VVRISALTGEGLDELYHVIVAKVWQDPLTAVPEVAINARHGALLEQAQLALHDALPLVGREEFELLAIHLRSAIAALGNITGKTTNPDLLHQIFSRFCIGK
jgi:tRNA modification GTPase